MTPEEAINRAIDAQHNDAARTWVAIAAELRAQQTTPALDRILGQARNVLPEPDPRLRLTLHDIEAKACEHGTSIHPPRLAIRDRRRGTWWMHVDDKTNCTDA